MKKQTQGMRVFRLPGGEIAYPVTVEKEGAWIGDGYDIAQPGTKEHARWAPFAVQAPKGMFEPAPEDDEEADEEP